jgi:hypothetical protein
MPAQAGTLSELIKIKIDQKMKAINGKGPLGLLSDTAYYEEFCKAIGTGYVKGSIGDIMFVTQDSGNAGAPPVPGTGSGTGIKVDSEYMTRTLYTAIKNKIVSKFGSTYHDDYPPASGNTGEYLKAMCEGVSEAVKEHYAVSWNLVSTHPSVYSGVGVINNGNYSGLSDSKITGLILSSSPRLKGSFWPEMAAEFASAYVKTIHTRSTGEVTITGACIPNMTQICGLPGSGAGQGSAL